MKALFTSIGLLAMVTALSACTSTPEPFEYYPATEVRQGPGLFSGEDGVFNIYSGPPPEKEPAKPPPEREANGN